MSVSISGAGSISGLDQGFNVTSGNLGIGTDTPSGSIHAHVASGTQRSYLEASAAHSFLRLKSGSTSYNSGIEFFSGASNIANVNGLGAGGLQFEVNGSERLHIDSSGNLLLKTGEIDIQGGNKTVKTSAGFLQLGTSGSHHTAIITAGSERLRIDSNGHLLHGVTADEDTSGNGGLRFINSGDIQIDGDQKALVFRSTNNTAQLQSAIEWWNENGAGVQSKIACDRTAVSQAPGDLVFYTSPNVDSGGTSSDGDITEHLRITSAGETLISNSANRFLSLDRTNASSGSGEFNLNVESNSQTTVSYDDGAQIVIGTSSSPRTQAGFSEKLRITSDGKIGIGYNNPSYMLEVHNPNPGNDSKQLLQRWVNTQQNTLELHMYGGSIDQCQFATTNSEQTLNFLTGVASGNVDSTEVSLLLTQNRDAWLQGPDTSNYGGGLFIGAEASPYGNLCALRDNNKRPLLYMGGQYPEITLAHSIPSNANHGPAIRFATYIQSTNAATGSQFVIGTNGSGTFLDIGHATAGQNKNVHAGIANYAGTMRFRVTTSGCQVNGSLSKSSGSFRIDHPLVGLSTTRDLVHSFIEGPQADLIYRGVVDLVDGTATVNIDTAGRMTEGTFEVLCTNVSCFTSNETDWTAVKGSVSGNILTITAQDNTSTATVSWMVVGERKDPHMIDTDWTDENGRVITEPLKSS